MNNQVLLVSDRKYITSDIMGGVQLCTHEYIKYLNSAGYEVKEFLVEPAISLGKRIKIKFGVDTYDHYDIGPYLSNLVHTINSSGVKLVLFNQLNLSPWAAHLKDHVSAGVKFIGLSHGNESADYLNDITKPGKATFIQTWKLGKLLVKENKLFTSVLDGIIVLSGQEIAINQWLGANDLLFLPRLLSPGFLEWEPTETVAGFVGTLDHRPNFLGISYLADELQQIGFNYKLELIGGPKAIGEQLAKKYDFIRYIGPISDQQLSKQVKTWSVFINPVFWYARGASTKLAQAINWGLPCLTTPAGKRGYDLTDESIVTADNSPKTFANTLDKALADKNYLHRLKKASESNALNFDKRPYVDQLKKFLDRLINTDH